MADGTQSVAAISADSLDGGAVLFALSGKRYAIPLAAVEAIMPPPSLCRVPHAPSSLLGAGNLGGQVLPIIDLAAIFPGTRWRRRYDGGGEVLRVRAAGGSVGLWIDRVERLVGPGTPGTEAVTMIDPEPLVRAGMTAPNLASELRHPLGDASEIMARTTAPTATSGYFLVEAAGENVRLAREAVLEFIDTPPWTPIPGAPAPLLGVGIVRGDALPMLSLAALLDLPESGPPGNFAVVALADGCRLLLGFNRVIGLRSQRQRRGRRMDDRVSDTLAGAVEDGRTFDPATEIPKQLRRIVSGFATSKATARQTDTLGPSGTTQYLAFVVGEQHHALPVEAIDRVVSARKLVTLPRHSGGKGTMRDAITGALELRGQLVPVARLQAAAEEEKAATSSEPGVYVVLRGAAGLMAIGADRVERLVMLRPDQISPTPARDDMIAGVALLDEAGDFLRILAPDRVGYAS